MNEREIEILIEVVRTGSFNKASNTLYLSQSAITQSMNSLEQELNIKLLNRTNKGVELTEAGEELFSDILNLYRQISSIHQKAEILSKGKSHALTIGMLPTVANTWFPNIVADYIHQNMDINISIRTLTSELPELLSLGKIEVAIDNIDRLRDFDCIALFEEEYFAVFPKNYRIDHFSDTITQKDLKNHTMIVDKKDLFNSKNIPINEKKVELWCDDASSFFSLVEKGLGFAILPESALKYKKNDFIIFHLSPSVKRTIGIATKKSASKIALQFTSFIIKHFKKYYSQKEDMN